MNTMSDVPTPDRVSAPPLEIHTSVQFLSFLTALRTRLEYRHDLLHPRGMISDWAVFSSTSLTLKHSLRSTVEPRDRPLGRVKFSCWKYPGIVDCASTRRSERALGGFRLCQPLCDT